MSGMEKSVSELHIMLRAVEASMKRAPATVLIAQKDQGEGEGKRKANAVDGETKPAAKPNPQPAKKAKPAKDAICLLRNCKLYLEDQKNKKER